MFSLSLSETIKRGPSKLHTAIKSKPPPILDCIVEHVVTTKSKNGSHCLSLQRQSSPQGAGQTSASILTADGDVRQLINTLPSAFSCNSIVPGDAATTDDMVGTSNYQNSHLVSFPDSSSTTTSLLAQYSPMQETFTDDNSTHTTSVVSAGILSHVS